MRPKTLVMAIAILFLPVISNMGCSNNGRISAYTEDRDWIKELGYKESEVHELTFDGTGCCPEIPIEIGKKKYKVLFDTGCSFGLGLTDAIGDDITYTLLGETELVNRDGSHQGWAKRVK